MKDMKANPFTEQDLINIINDADLTDSQALKILRKLRKKTITASHL